MANERSVRELSVEDLRNGNLGEDEQLPALMVAPEDPIEQSELDKLQSAIAQLGGEANEAFVSIWRVVATGPDVFVKKMSALEFADNGVEFIAENYGSGKYHIYVYNSNKRLVKGGNKIIAVEAPQKPPAAPAAPPSNNDSIAQLARVMIEGFNRLGERIAQLAQPQGQSRREMLNELILMRQIFGPTQQPAANKDPMEMFRLGLEMARDLGTGDNENAFVRLAEKFAPAITEAVKTMGATKPALPLASSDHNVRAGPAAALPANPEQLGAKEMGLFLKMQLEYLVNEAKQDADPTPYAMLIVDKAPRELLVDLANNPAWLDKLAEHNSNVKQFPQWFGELRDAVVEILREEESADPDNLTPGADFAIHPAGSQPAGVNVPGSADGDESDNS